MADPRACTCMDTHAEIITEITDGNYDSALHHCQQMCSALPPAPPCHLTLTDTFPAPTFDLSTTLSPPMFAPPSPRWTVADARVRTLLSAQRTFDPGMVTRCGGRVLRSCLVRCRGHGAWIAPVLVVVDGLHAPPRLVFALVPPASWQKICSELGHALAAHNLPARDSDLAHGRRASDVDDLLAPLPEGSARDTWRTFCMLLLQSVPLHRHVACTDSDACLAVARASFVHGALAMTEPERTRAEQERAWAVFLQSIALPEARMAAAQHEPFVAPLFCGGYDAGVFPGFDAWPKALLGLDSGRDTRDAVLRHGMSLL